METIKIKGHTSTVNGKLIWVPEHDRHIEHALDDDFSALVAKHNIKPLTRSTPKAEPKPQAAAWTPGKPGELWIGHNNTDGHNKVYKVGVFADPNGKWHVVAAWGKAGSSTLAQQDKGTFDSFPQAQKEFSKLVQQKEKGDYHSANSTFWAGTESVPWQPIPGKAAPAESKAFTPPKDSEEEATWKKFIDDQEKKAVPEAHIVAEYEDKDAGTMVFVNKMKDGKYSVAMKDIESGEFLPSVMIYDDADKAEATAKKWANVKPPVITPAHPVHPDLDADFDKLVATLGVKPLATKPSEAPESPAKITTKTESGSMVGYTGPAGSASVSWKISGMKVELRIRMPYLQSKEHDEVKAGLEKLGAHWMPVAKEWAITLPGKPWAGGKPKAQAVHDLMASIVGPPTGETASPTKGPSVGDTKMDAGKKYVFNKNHRWELMETAAVVPPKTGWKAQSIAEIKTIWQTMAPGTVKTLNNGIVIEKSKPNGTILRVHKIKADGSGIKQSENTALLHAGGATHSNGKIAFLKNDINSALIELSHLTGKPTIIVPLAAPAGPTKTFKKGTTVEWDDIQPGMHVANSELEIDWTFVEKANGDWTINGPNGIYSTGQEEWDEFQGPSLPLVEDFTMALKVGTTKIENGKLYVLNANHKWELAEKESHGTPGFNYKQIGPQKGSNPGGLYEDEFGKKWYIKFPPTEDHAKNELLAAKLYEMAGVEVPTLKLVNNGGKVGIASLFLEGLTENASAIKKGAKGAKEGFAADAWLANRDVAGTKGGAENPAFDNMPVTKDGAAFRVDVGGSLLYRAMGAPKGDEFSTTVPEIETLRDSSINAITASIFGGMTKAQIEKSVESVLSIPEQDIRDAVAAYGPGNLAEKKKLADTIIARQNYLAKKYPGAKASAETGWMGLKPGEVVVEQGAELGIKWAKIKIPSGGFNPETIPAPEASDKSGSVHFNKANDAAKALIFQMAKAGKSPEEIGQVEVDDVNKETGQITGGKHKLKDHPSQYVRNYLTSVSSELSAQKGETFKTVTSGSFSGNYSKIAKKLSDLHPAIKHENFKHHTKKAADYLVLSSDAAKSIPVPKTGFKERTAAFLVGFKDKCSKAFKLLTHSEVSSAQDYTGSSYGYWNEQMRAGKIPEAAKPMVAAMAKAAQEIPEGSILWRGLNVGADTYKAQVGAILQDGSFQSTSFGSSPAFSNKKTWLRMYIPEGVKGLYAAGVFSVCGDGEREIILPPNCRYAVLKVTDGPHTIVDILVLPNDAEIAKETKL